ncbi:uncharacterized protein LOC126678633 [Mercurialis annua]|uniref:uncharacterized protein LOC126678633 n=1 Tax=Mercurialis annua TaxID=3986 RepID=UPI00215F9ECE|nr:uncharacterized protein LOC126678633 [Mercurialis annua]
MKRAKVSSVYEGRRIKRTKEENDYSSRKARINARARRNLKALYKIMATDRRNSDITEQEYAIFEADESRDIDVLGDIAKRGAKMEKWEGGAVWWEEWPLYWTYEEEWLWFEAECGCCYRSLPEVMNGIGLANGDDRYEKKVTFEES